MDKQSYRKILWNAWRTARQELVTPWLRRHRARIFQGYILIALIAFGVLAFLANTYPYLGFDLAFTRELQEDTAPFFGYLLQAISWPGYTVQSVVMIALIAIFLGFFGLRWESATLIIASAFTGLLNYLVKIFIRRPRPSEDLVDVVQSLNSYSFPSGHVMFYTMFFGFLLFLAFTLLKGSWKRLLLNLLLVAMIVLVGPSRMFLGEHWASDVLGGYLLGSLSLILVIQFYNWGKKRLHIDQPVADEGSDSGEFHIREEANRYQASIPITSPKDESHEHRSDRPERE